MFRTRHGATDARNLGMMLREIHAERSASRLAEIAERKAADAPLVHESTGEPMEPMGEYSADDELDSLTAHIRILPKHRLSELAQIGIEAAEAGITEVLARMRSFVASTVVRVSGFEDAAGEYEIGGDSLSGDDVDALDAFNLISPLFTVAQEVQGLSGKELRRFGLQAPLISAHSNAASAVIEPA